MPENVRETESLGDTVQSSGTPAPSSSTLREGEVLLERFKLLRLVGRGGMGEVYEARDLRLHATVALKTVRTSSTAAPELLERLRREVQLARVVTHPNVCRVFDFHEGSGPDEKPVAFVTMEYLDGETLAERLASAPLPPREAIPLLEQMAEGLAAIHARGLIHRDFKPGNVMLVHEGGELRAVVTDFGIARAARGSGNHTGWVGTEEGAVIGSPAYMSPEQRQGSEVTARTDIHALALVACEMVSGRLPSESGVLDHVPRAWAPALRRALDADPERRPADPRALVATLEGGKRRRRRLAAGVTLAVALVAAGAVTMALRGRTPRADRLAIAVLPLANLGGGPDSDYFGDGLTEDINTQLTKMRTLHVIARGSTRPYKGTTRPLREIAQELGVGTLLEGSIRRAGGRIRITAQLIDAGTERQLWAETYDRDPRDVLDVQTDVASKVAAALALRLTEADGARLRRGTTSNPEAYDFYLKGVAHAGNGSGKELRAAMSDFEHAVALDPGYALAHAELGDAYLRYGLYNDAEDPQWIDRARSSVNRALELEPGLALPHVALGQLLFSRYSGWDFDGAMKEFARARALEPDSAHIWAASVMGHVGLEPAVREAELALKLNPRGTLVRLVTVLAYEWTARFNEALSRSRELAERPSDRLRGLPSMLRVGRLDEAVALAETPDPDEVFPETPDTTRALILAVAGKKDEAAFLAKLFAGGYPLEPGEWAHHSMYELACTESLIGHPTEAVGWLRKAAESGFPNYLLFSRDPLLDPIRSDPGFVQLMAELRPRWERWKADHP
jgi:TolB-like protein/tetratricopeptide (TPR) repeat protein